MPYGVLCHYDKFLNDISYESWDTQLTLFVKVQKNYIFPNFGHISIYNTQCP